MRTTETTCLSDELCFRKEEDGQIVSLGDSRIERVRDRLNMLTARVAVLEYSQLHKKVYSMVVCEFGGFENVLRDAGIRVYYASHAGMAHDKRKAGSR